jgi:hypothetical protein
MKFSREVMPLIDAINVYAVQIGQTSEVDAKLAPKYSH